MREMPTSCPVQQLEFDLADLEPLLHALQQDHLPEQIARFPKGVLNPDGRLDMCKQNLGVSGCGSLAETLRSQHLIDTLLLGTNAIGDEGAKLVADLIRYGHLKTVYLGCNMIGSEGVKTITQALAQNQKVEALWLKRNPIGADGWRYLAQMLEQNTTLRTLDLVNTSPNSQSMLELLEVVKTHPSLEYLYLSGNGLDAQEASALSDCLVQSSLKGIYLSVNHLENDGAATLARGLERNNHLQHLGVASNGINDEGIKALLEVVIQHPSLISLDLGYAPSTKTLDAKPNHLTNEAFASLIHLINNHKTLQDLNVSSNSFSTSIKLELRQAAQASTSIKRFLCGDKHSIRQITHLHTDAAKIRSVYR
jgi:Ran GTPase-activating protein (RanGAP) involved in mRNA processing and transport